MISVNKHRLLVILVGLVGGFLIVTIGVANGNVVLAQFDTYITTQIQRLTTERITTLMIVVTNIGSYKVEYPLLLLLATFWWYRKYLLYPIVLFVDLIGVQIFNYLLKVIFVRERPVFEHLVMASGYSFPSGHAMITTGFYGFVTYLVCRSENVNKFSRYVIGIGMVSLILLIGISRIYLGVHYPSDVIGGFLMGSSWLLIMIFILHKLQGLPKTSNGGTVHGH